MDQPLFNDRYRIASARLPGYDYGQNGAYFFTICTQQRTRYFGDIVVPEQDWSRACVHPTTIAATPPQPAAAVTGRFGWGWGRMAGRWAGRGWQWCGFGWPQITGIVVVNTIG